MSGTATSEGRPARAPPAGARPTRPRRPRTVGAPERPPVPRSTIQPIATAAKADAGTSRAGRPDGAQQEHHEDQHQPEEREPRPAACAAPAQGGRRLTGRTPGGRARERGARPGRPSAAWSAAPPSRSRFPASTSGRGYSGRDAGADRSPALRAGRPDERHEGHGTHDDGSRGRGSSEDHEDAEDRSATPSGSESPSRRSRGEATWPIGEARRPGRTTAVRGRGRTHCRGPRASCRHSQHLGRRPGSARAARRGAQPQLPGPAGPGHRGGDDASDRSQQVYIEAAALRRRPPRPSGAARRSAAPPARLRWPRGASRSASRSDRVGSRIMRQPRERRRRGRDR